MNAHGTARLWLKLAALAPAFLIGLPVQALLLRMRPALARRLPVLFHRYLCLVLGVRRRTLAGTPPQGAALILSNHVSWLDIVVLGSLAPVSFIAKADVAGWPVFGTLARLQGTLFVDRTRRTATGTARDGIADRLAAGERMILFAEGTTSDGNRVLPYRSALVGAALAERHDLPVALVPLALCYTHRDGLPLTRRERPDIAWYGAMELLPHLKALLAGGPVDVAITWGQPLQPSDAADRKHLTRQAESFARQAVAAGFRPSSNTI